MQTYNLIDDFLYIIELMAKLQSHIDSELFSMPAWLGEELIKEDKTQLKYAFSEWSYDSEIGQATLSCPGALAGTNKTIQLITHINEAKDTFRAAATHYLKEKKLTDTKVIRQLLKQAGYAVRLRQVYRHIRTLDFHPKRISFTQTHHNSYRIISKEEAFRKLDKVGIGPNIDWQKAKLAALGNEKLVIRHDIKPVWAVNASTFKNEGGRSQTLKVLTRLPIVYVHDTTKPYPLVGFSRSYQRHKKTPRCDKLIESNLFLPSIFAYRYQQ